MPRVYLRQSKTQGQPKTAGNLVRKKKIQNALSTLDWAVLRAPKRILQCRERPGLDSEADRDRYSPDSLLPNMVTLSRSPALVLGLSFHPCRMEIVAHPPPRATVRNK